MTVRVWRCRAVKAGVKCDTLNLRTKVKCSQPGCTGRRPKPRKPAHMAALDAFNYVQWVAEHGETCSICGAGPKPGKRLHRDHEHKGDGYVRGLLCFQCNRKLGNKTAEWLCAAAIYLERAEQFRPRPATQNANESRA